MQPNQRKATYQDLLAVPDHLIAQIIDGELITLPRPAIQHARIASIIGTDLGGPFMRGRGGPGGWWILDEAELHLHDHVLVPDILGYRRERLPELPNSAAFTIAPDWVCEVLSPRTAALDRVRKMRVYLNQGVSFAWLIDPEARVIEAYEAQAERWVQAGVYGADEDEKEVRIVPFAAVALEISSWWPPREPAA